MAVVNPSYMFNNALRGVLKNPNFRQLSPAAQAAIQQLASQPQGSTLAEFSNNAAAYQAALAEARQKGLLDNSPLWQDVLKGTGIALGTAALGPALGAVAGGGTAAAPTAGTTLGEAGPLSADKVFTAGPIAGSGIEGGTAAAAPIVAGASSGFGAALKSVLPAIIGGGASVAGAAIASHGNTEAAKIAAAEQDKALAQAKEVYQQQRADEGPYVKSGYGALNAINFGLGLPPQAYEAPPPAPSTAVASGAVDASGNPLPGAGSAGTITPPTPAQQRMPSTLVKVQNPATGLVHLIPQTDVPAAQQAGGVLV